ncbi:hypothetical protein [Sediminitomix flava]|uniref:Uncharacterized protein n=1 Tax=Sediminitomix flava TaxID=379075 RepID=A0A315ZH90_SEDFL|nr:hypothetical protein [Sediminitomix flava]PWJ44510.1 hypothetical protein BC781_101881 [Sediminitomix flava]
MPKLPTLKKRNSSATTVQTVCFDGPILISELYQDPSSQKHIRSKDPIKLVAEEGKWNVYWQKKYLLGQLPQDIYPTLEGIMNKGDKIEGRVSKTGAQIHVALYQIS